MSEIFFDDYQSDFFQEYEWRCECCGVPALETELTEPLKDFVIKLDRARDYSGVPYVISSWYRCSEHNFEIGGSEDSSHLKGLAVDIVTVNSHTRFLILKGLLRAGFTRIGIYEKHIHVDADTTKPQEVAWFGRYK